MTNNITRIDALTYAIDTLAALETADAQMLTKLNEMRESLKNSKSQVSEKELSKRAELEEVENAILEVLSSAAEAMKLSDIRAQSETLGKYSQQKASAAMTKLKNAGKVTRLEDKRVAYFTLA